MKRTLKTLRIRLDSEVAELLKKHKKKTGVSVNLFIRIAVDQRIEFLNSLNK
jgi:predicted DNA-binding protein